MGKCPPALSGGILPALPAQAYEDARAAAPGYDIHALEQEWRAWWAGSNKPKIEHSRLPSWVFVEARIGGRQSIDNMVRRADPLPYPDFRDF